MLSYEVVIFVFYLGLTFGEQDANEFCFNKIGRRNSKDMYAADDDCHAFYQCFYFNSSVAIGLRKNCAPGLFWNDLHLQCVPENPETPCRDRCSDTSTASIGCYGDDSNCAKYYVCSNEISYQFCCPPKTRFNQKVCQCLEDETCLQQCSYPEVVTTTVKPSTIINTTLCQDSYGNYLAPVREDITKFKVVNLEFPEISHIQSCAPGTAFTVYSCACDINVKAERVANGRYASLYLPFDGDYDDDSYLKVETEIVGNAEFSYATYAHGGGSLKAYGGWLEVPAFKNLDLRDAASWCFFYRCGLDVSKKSQCLQSGGILSNSDGANSKNFSIIVNSGSSNSIGVSVGFKHPNVQESFVETLERSTAKETHEFQQVCIVHEDSTTSLYIDAKLVSSVATSKTFATTHLPLAIGHDPQYGAFIGYIDEVLFCKFAMTQSEVEAHFRGNDAMVNEGILPENNRIGLYDVPNYQGLEVEWPKWAAKYGVDPENLAKKNNFAKTLEEVKEHNEQYKLGKVRNIMTLSKFAADSRLEMASRFGLALPPGYTPPKRSNLLMSVECETDEYFDWVDLQTVLEPFHQQSCGSCWAVAAAGCIENQLAIHCGIKGVRLSIQQLLDCAWSTGNMGCQGGLMSYAFQYMMENGGLHANASYSYRNDADETCRTDAKLPCYGKVASFHEIVGDDCNIAYSLKTLGVLAIGMEINSDFINHKAGTIYKSTGCMKPAWLGHAMQIVGYGKDVTTGELYWRVKNSWGDDWCEHGYIRVIRENSSMDNMCGIRNLVSVPVLDFAEACGYQDNGSGDEGEIIP